VRRSLSTHGKHYVCVQHPSKSPLFNILYRSAIVATFSKAHIAPSIPMSYGGRLLHKLLFMIHNLCNIAR